MKRDLDPLMQATVLLPEVAGGRTNLWRVAGLIILVFAWTLAWYAETAGQIAEIWWRSDTYAHGLIVLPVFAWLVWRARDRLVRRALQPVPWLALPALVAGLGWMLGEVVSVAAASHFFLVTVLVISLVAVLGWDLSRVLLFPFAFLFFGVPIGDFLLPILMTHTADFTVWALRLSGVPVYQEGLFFVVPNGRWSVVEACSGIRYLIASLTVGSLYAYLNYRSLKRRLLFMIVALLVPVVANWLRAYLIVMLGYLSDNKIATGVDHLIYGWIFFGLIVFLMFWIGSRWHEAPATLREALPAVRRGNFKAWLALMPLFAVAPLFSMLDHNPGEPAADFILRPELPAAVGGWERTEGGPAYRPHYAGHRGEAVASYRDPAGGIVTIYVALYAAQQPGREMVTWGNGLLPNERRTANLMYSEDINLKGQHYRRATAATDQERVRVWQWYRINGSSIVSDAELKLRLAADRLLGLADESAVIVVMTPEDDLLDGADKRIADFLRLHGPALEATIDATGEGRS